LPAVPWKEPAAQGVQEAEASEAEKEPMGQLVQEERALLGALPAVQGVHLVAPEAAMLPAGQASQPLLSFFGMEPVGQVKHALVPPGLTWLLVHGLQELPLGPEPGLQPWRRLSSPALT
jgi:hypothetical protein